jgi:hypothetical protein
MNHETIVAVSTAAELAQVNGERSPIPSPVPTESPVARGAWTRDIEALCRALEAQRRAHFPPIDPEGK